MDSTTHFLLRGLGRIQCRLVFKQTWTAFYHKLAATNETQANRNLTQSSAIEMRKHRDCKPYLVGSRLDAILKGFESACGRSPRSKAYEEFGQKAQQHCRKPSILLVRSLVC